ncbi:hypothetical protein E2986_11337, partial [Frieseomelitta varia]
PNIYIHKDTNPLHPPFYINLYIRAVSKEGKRKNYFLLSFKAPTSAVAPTSTESAPKEEKKKEEPDEPESDEDMGFGIWIVTFNDYYHVLATDIMIV